MIPISHHILTATGDEPPHEPAAVRGDIIVLIFCLGVGLGWLIGAA